MLREKYAYGQVPGRLCAHVPKDTLGLAQDYSLAPAVCAPSMPQLYKVPHAFCFPVFGISTPACPGETCPANACPFTRKPGSFGAGWSNLKLRISKKEMLE